MAGGKIVADCDLSRVIGWDPSPMAQAKHFETQWGGKTLSIEVGKYANQANGSCLVRYGDTIVLGTAVMSAQKREGLEFFPLMVEYEEKRLFEDFKNQISQNVKIDFGQYLASIKKTEDEIKKSFKLEAEKRIKNFLTLRQIGKSESIEVLEKELEEEISKVLKSYSKEQLEKPFGATQGKFDIGELKEYTKGAMFNEKVFEKLESFSKI